MQVLAAGVLALRVLSHNIRYAADPPSKGEAPWPERFPDLLAQLKYHTDYTPQSLICLQEVLHGQLDDILQGLNSAGNDWAHIGVGRDDGLAAGEYCPILYRQSHWELRKFQYFWLSQTPDRPSLGWDAGSIRIVTIGTLRNKALQRDVVAFNTHLDNAGTVARQKGANLILERIEAYLTGDASAKHRAIPVFLAGDMNSNETQEAYQVLTGSKSPLVDIKNVVPPDSVYGYNDTFTGFDDEEEAEDGRIDYVFASHKPPLSWTGRAFATLPNLFEDASGVRFSDHRAIVADIELPPGK